MTNGKARNLLGHPETVFGREKGSMAKLIWETMH